MHRLERDAGTTSGVTGAPLYTPLTRAPTGSSARQLERRIHLPALGQKLQPALVAGFPLGCAPARPAAARLASLRLVGLAGREDGLALHHPPARGTLQRMRDSCTRGCGGGGGRATEGQQLGSAAAPAVLLAAPELAIRVELRGRRHQRVLCAVRQQLHGLVHPDRLAVRIQRLGLLPHRAQPPPESLRARMASSVPSPWRCGSSLDGSDGNRAAWSTIADAVTVMAIKGSHVYGDGEHKNSHAGGHEVEEHGLPCLLGSRCRCHASPRCPHAAARAAPAPPAPWPYQSAASAGIT